MATLEVIATVTALALLPAGRELELGESITLRVTDQDGGALDASFVSSDPSVAIFSGSGVLEGLASGEVRVVARAAGLVVEGVFTVIAAPDEVVAAGGQPDPADATIVFVGASGVDQAPRRLWDQAEIQRITDEEYPLTLRDQGVGGMVLIRIRVFDNGEVAGMELVPGRGSGYDVLDDAALRVALRVLRFSPAIDDGQPLAVSLLETITFEP